MGEETPSLCGAQKEARNNSRYVGTFELSEPKMRRRRMRGADSTHVLGFRPPQIVCDDWTHTVIDISWSKHLREAYMVFGKVENDHQPSDNHPKNSTDNSRSILENHLRITMQIYFVLLLLVVALVSGASAAECYSRSGSKHCVDKAPLAEYHRFFCTWEWQKLGTSKVYNANDGCSASFLLRSGAFASQQERLDSTESITNDCYEKKDGGVWSYSND